MIYIYVIVLGLVQGLTEFLPVSSSGHLILLENLFDKPSLFFNVMLHFATLMSVIVVMRKRIKDLILHPLTKTNLFILLSMIPTGLIAFVIKLHFPQLLDGTLLPFGFLVTSALLILPALSGKSRNLNAKTSFSAGIAQGIAVLPGISRSGAVISVLTVLGVPDNESAEFAFLMSIPIIIGSTAVELLSAERIFIGELFPVLLGMCVAFVSGTFALKFMLGKLNGKNLARFAPYTFTLSALSYVLAQL